MDKGFHTEGSQQMGKSNVGLWIVLVMVVLIVGGLVMNFVTSS